MEITKGTQPTPDFQNYVFGKLKLVNIFLIPVNYIWKLIIAKFRFAIRIFLERERRVKLQGTFGIWYKVVNALTAKSFQLNISNYSTLYYI